jgi:hypothetical protein
MSGNKSKTKPETGPAVTLDAVDEFDQCCAQAIAIASLLMEVDSDPAVQDSAWAVRSLIERATAISGALFRRS